MTKKTSNKTFLWLTEEWLIILIAVLILLAIAIGAAGARTFMTPKTGTSQTLSATVAGDEKE